MRKRKKFHEVRYPKRVVSKGGAPSSLTPGMAASGTNVEETTDIENGSMIWSGDEDQPERDEASLRFSRICGINVPDPEDEIKVINHRKPYDASEGGRIEDCIIMLTDIETGFFRQCVESKDGGGWYGDSNRLDVEKYGLNQYDTLKTEHMPVVEEREREDLVVRLIYRKAYHRATADIYAFGKSVEIFVQDCWFKCYLPWPCLPRDIPQSVDVANNILQRLEPEIKEQVKIVQPKIKAELRRRKSSGEYELDAMFSQVGLKHWVELPVPSNRDELDELEAFYDKNYERHARIMNAPPGEPIADLVINIPRVR